MNEKLIITSTLGHIDSKPPRTRSERFFALVVCLHLSCKNHSQNANVIVLRRIFVGWWKVTRKPLGHYRTERRKTERSGTSVHQWTDLSDGEREKPTGFSPWDESEPTYLIQTLEISMRLCYLYIWWLVRRDERHFDRVFATTPTGQ